MAADKFIITAFIALLICPIWGHAHNNLRLPIIQKNYFNYLIQACVLIYLKIMNTT